MEKVTLKSIAEQAGVSLTTVHRVLNGKGGTSKAVEEKILRIAKEQGYAINMAASNLRKTPLNIALVFPRMDKSAHYFINRILDGYLGFRREVSQLNVVFQEFYFGMGDTAENPYVELENILKKIYREQPVRYDGVVVYGLSITSRVEALLNRIVGSGTKVVVLERCPEGLFDVCSVEVNDRIAGNLAGDLLVQAVRTDGTVVIINQELPEGDPNGEACAQYICAERPNLKVVQAALPLTDDQSAAIGQILKAHPDICAAYATSARHTNSLLKALEKTGIKLQAVIGSELFEESYRVLHSRKLNAVIDKRPEHIGYKALQLMIGALVRKEELPTIHRVTPRIILRANSDKYYVEKENLYGKTLYPE